ncbi:MAG: AraC family transcriptional regulator [Ruminococcaceae bacterium]|nr:AraC family transcriptional regulator [Oscillospiraceae bacterium]
MSSEMIVNAHYQGLNPVQFGYEHCAPFHSYGPAVRTHWLLHYVVCGKGKFIKKGITYEVGQGDTFVISPYEETYYEADGDNPWYYIWIGFTGEVPVALDTAVLHIPALGRIFEGAKNCHHFTGGRSAFLSGKLWEIFSCILENRDATLDYVGQTVHCISLEYANGITISQIAKRLNINRSYLSALFKKQFGVSPQEYLTAFRIQKAEELMLEHGKSPTVAAISTGYSDVYQFSRMFKRCRGLSPRKYIAAYSKKPE